MQELRDLTNYVPVTDNVLNYLSHYKISTSFKSIRLEIYRVLKGNKIDISGFSLEFDPEVVKYFQGLNEHFCCFENFENEPKEIVKLKKILNLMFMIEKILTDVENTKAVFQYETFVRFHPIQTQIHEAVRLIFELNIDSWGVLNEHSVSGVQWIVADLQNMMMDIVSIFQVQSSEYNAGETILKLKDKLSSILEYLRGKKIAADAGFMSGMLIDLLPPGQSVFFIGQLIALIPYSFEQVSSHIKGISEHLSAEQSHIPSSKWIELESNLSKIISSIFNLEDTAFSLGSNILATIYHLRLVFDFAKEVIQNIGHFSPETQSFFKDKISFFKYKLLPQFMMSIDVLESQLMLKNGTISGGILPYIENFYQLITRLVQQIIDFNEVDRDLYWLRESNWNRLYIQQHLRYQGTIETQRQIFKKIIQNFEKWSTADNPWDLNDDDFKANFAVISPYLAKIDAKLHNKIFRLIEENDKILSVSIKLNSYSDLQKIFALQLIKKQNDLILENKNKIFFEYRQSHAPALVRQALEQEYQQQTFYLAMSVARIQSLNQSSKKDLSFIAFSEERDYEQLTSLFYGTYALVMVKKQNPEMTSWFWVDKNQKNVVGIDANDFIEGLSHRFYIEGISQKLSMDEIQAIEKYMSINCDAEIASSKPELSILSSDEVYPQFLLTKSAYESAITFFNILTKVVNQEKLVAHLSKSEKLQLRNAKKGFEELYPMDLNQTVANLLDNKRDIFIFLTEILHNFDLQIKEQFHTAYLNYCNNQKQQLALVDREDYFLKTKRLSTFVTEVQSYFSSFFKIYSDSLQHYYEIPGAVFQDFKQPDELEILREPQQVVEQRLIYKSLGYLKAMFENLESYQISNFDNHYIKLHLDIIISYLNFNTITFTYLKTDHHRALLNQFKQIVTSRFQHASSKMNYYGLGEWNPSEHEKLFKGVYEGVHRIYSLPPIIENLNEITPLSEAQLRLMREQYSKVSDDVVDFLVHTNSYWWMLLHIPSISKLFVDIKDKYQEASMALHTKTFDNLYDLKETLFKEILIECDLIELNLGLKPEFFSHHIAMVVDVFFENLLKPLELDIAKFAKLSLKNDLYGLRCEHLKCRQREIEYHRAALESDLKDIIFFEENLSKHAFGKILPYLVKFNHSRTYASPTALLSAKIIESDKKYRKWIKEICEEDICIREKLSTEGTLPDFDANTYNDMMELKNYVKSAIEGLIATEKVKLEICKQKITFIEADIEKKQQEQSCKIQTIIDERFSKNVKRLISKMPFHEDVLNLYALEFEKYMDLHRDNIESQMYEIVQRQMPTITDIKANEAAFVGVANRDFYTLMNDEAQKFVQENYNSFCQLHDIMNQLDAFEIYVQTQQHLINENQFLWFEDNETLDKKIKALSELKKYALTEEVPILERLEHLKNNINSADFKLIMTGYAPIQSSNLTQLTQYFWLFLSWLGLYQLEQKTLYRNLQSECKEYPSIPISISNYGLFEERDASYQDDFIENVRQGLTLGN